MQITLLDLPPEIIQRIGIELPPSSLVNTFAPICKYIYSSFDETDQNDQIFWKTYAIEKYRILLSREELNKFKSRTGAPTWKDFVKHLHSLDTSNSLYATGVPINSEYF
jgi:hypothetical protein